MLVAYPDFQRAPREIQRFLFIQLGGGVTFRNHFHADFGGDGAFRFRSDRFESFARRPSHVGNLGAFIRFDGALGQNFSLADIDVEQGRDFSLKSGVINLHWGH